jgi:AAA lid domain
MTEFLSANPGLASRIAHHIDFPGYAQGELVEIGNRMVTAAGLRLSPDGAAAFAEYVALRMAQPRFGNARSIRNAVDRARLRQAQRLCSAGGRVGRCDLATLEAADFRASRVFTAPPAP